MNNGPDKMVYAGPTMSYYERLRPTTQRQTDVEWTAELNSTPPPRPAWTKAYLPQP